jgi:hypothetical protein
MEQLHQLDDHRGLFALSLLLAVQVMLPKLFN